MERKQQRPSVSGQVCLHCVPVAYNTSFVVSRLHLVSESHLRHKKGSVAEQVGGHQQGSDHRQICFIITETDREREGSNSGFVYSTQSFL